MPEVIVGRPFGKLELADQHRLQPTALFHLGCGESLAPSASPSFRQIGKWTRNSLKSVEAAEQLFPRCWRESVACSCDINELAAFVIAKNQCVEVLGLESSKGSSSQEFVHFFIANWESVVV